MYFGINWQLILGLLLITHYGGADSVEDSGSEEETVPSFHPQIRIVGGGNAREGQFPHQVSLRWFGYHICGGSIISPNYIVTAGHCVVSGAERTVKPASTLSIRAGSIRKDTGGQVVGVATVIVHPSYVNFDNDIALLRLSDPLEFNDQVKAIALTTESPRTGVPIITSGWGGLYTGGPLPNILQYNTFAYLDRDDCGRYLSGVPFTVFCLAHRSNNGVCHGDSGGPAIYRDKLVGVANFVVGGCGNNNPDGFASVYAHSDWIKTNSDL